MNDDLAREPIHPGEHLADKLAVLDAAIARGIADADAGRVHTTDEVREHFRRRFRESTHKETAQADPMLESGSSA